MKDVGVLIMMFDVMTVNLVDNRGIVIVDDFGVGGMWGFKIMVMLNILFFMDILGVMMMMVLFIIIILDGKVMF